LDFGRDQDEILQLLAPAPTSVLMFLRVCPGTSNGIAEFSEHEAD
jgi:hypothetical protein